MAAPSDNTYNAAHLLVLEGLDAVRKRPGMYIGSTDTRGLMHCLWEIIDNGVDEALAGVAHHVEVTLHDDGSVEVYDDGRGIPTDKEPKTGLPGVEVVPDPPQTPATPSPEVDPPRAGPTKVLFFGDSYVVGGAYTDAEGSMAAIAARRLGWEYQIRGAGGTGFVAGNAEFGLPAYPEQIDQGALDVGEVDWLVVEGGGGDTDRGVAPARV